MEGSAFRWRSWLGLAIGLFLLFGAANALAAIWVPTSLVTAGSGGTAGAGGGPVFNATGDAYLVGAPLTSLRQTNPKLDALLVSSMVQMCSMMMGLAVLYLAVAWFGLREGRRWALWALLAGALVSVPYYLVLGALYSGQGAPDVISGVIGVLAFYLIPVLGFVAGMAGLRRAYGRRPDTVLVPPAAP